MFSKRFLITLFLYFFSLDTTSAKPFIDGLTACKRDDPKLNNCILNIIKQAKPQLLQGIPQLNLPPLDPINIPRLPIDKVLPDINVTGQLTNLTASGAASMTVGSLKVNLTEKTWDMVVIIPLVKFSTDFNLNISLNALRMPLYGKGECNGKISHSSIRFHADTEIKDDKLKMVDVKTNLNLGDVEVHISKSQFPALAQTATNFFHSNKRLVIEVVTPIAEEAANKLLLRQGNKILSTTKITDLLID